MARFDIFPIVRFGVPSRVPTHFLAGDAVAFVAFVAGALERSDRVSAGGVVLRTTGSGVQFSDRGGRQDQVPSGVSGVPIDSNRRRLGSRAPHDCFANQEPPSVSVADVDLCTRFPRPKPMSLNKV